MADIIELLERRNESRLVLLKEKYSEYCYSIIYNLLRDHEQTEKALQDMWLQDNAPCHMFRKCLFTDIL